jgi:hypothetical protein
MVLHGQKPRYIVREREFIALSKPLAFSGKRVARWDKWKTLWRTWDFEEACAKRSARTTGLFERVVFYRGYIIVEADGRQTVCGPPGHAHPCTCQSHPKS